VVGVGVGVTVAAGVVAEEILGQLAAAAVVVAVAVES